LGNVSAIEIVDELLTTMLIVYVAVPPFESVTVAVTALVPAAVGVPPTVTVADDVFDGVTPAGRPETAHVYVAVPPLAVSEPEYAVPTVPVAANAPVIITGFEAAEIVTVVVFVAKRPFVSRTVAATLYVPAVVGGLPRPALKSKFRSPSRREAVA